MFLLNLGLVEFLAIFGALSGVVVALYLLDRSRRRQVVATLRFWTAAMRPPESRHRRKIQQPMSLVLQLLGLLLLLLALAQLRLGSPDKSSRDHIVMLDTSAWMAARAPRGRLMDEAKAAVRAYVRALPATDRVMLARVDAVTTPATGFETDRGKVDQAIRESQPGFAALDLDQAFRFARQMQKLHSRRSGEVVYAGPGRIIEKNGQDAPAAPEDLRILPVSEPGPNIGLRKIAVQRSQSDPGLWHIFVGVRNYTAQPRTVPLYLLFGGAPVGSTRMNINAGQEQSSEFEFRTKAAGWLEARIQTQDSVPSDDRALIELPQQKGVKVLVYTSDAEGLRPLLASNPLIDVTFAAPSTYQEAPDAQIVVLDRFRPRTPPKRNAVWIEPPSDGSPVPVASSSDNVVLTGWRTDHPLGAGLHTKDLRIEHSLVFPNSPNFINLAQVSSGSIITAVDGAQKTVVFGFHPGRSSMRFELSAPLVFANIVNWMAPDALRRREMNGASVGAVAVALDEKTDASKIRVLGDGDRPIPFTLNGTTLSLYSATPGIVRILAGDRELVYSQTLPEIAEAKWEAPKTVRRGIPRRFELVPSSRDLWQWLALAGGIILLLEWLMYGRSKPVAALRRVFGMMPSIPLRRAS